MIEPRQAHLAYLTNPERGVVVLTVLEAGKPGDEALAFSLNRDQLFRLNAETADILLKEVQR
jgi:hypothetical protein